MAGTLTAGVLAQLGAKTSAYGTGTSMTACLRVDIKHPTHFVMHIVFEGGFALQRWLLPISWYKLQLVLFW